MLSRRPSPRTARRRARRSESILLISHDWRGHRPRRTEPHHLATFTCCTQPPMIPSISMSITLQLGPNAAEVTRHMKYRRYLLDIAIPGLEGFRQTFEASRSVFMDETRSAVERWCVINPSGDPSADLDSNGWSFDLVTGDMYKDMHVMLEDMHGIVETRWKLFHDQLEAIEARLRELTGKGVDELDAQGLDFWDECNS